MKVAFINSGGFDYVQDLTFYGLRNVLGRNRVTDYPWNKKYHLPLWHYPKNIGYEPESIFDLPSAISDIKDAEVVIVGAVKADAFKSLISCIRLIPAAATLVLIDGGDSGDIGGDLAREGQQYLLDQARSIRPFDLIFKREFLEDFRYPRNTFPFPMCFKYSDRIYPSGIKKFDVAFWGVESNQIRSFALTQLRDNFDCRQNGTVENQSFANYKRRGAAYLNALSECKVSLNFRGVGFDTLRFWEALGVGSFLLSQRPKIVIPEPFLSHHHLVYLEDDIQDLIDKCKYYLKNESKRESIAQAGTAHLRTHHTINKRINFLLEEIYSFKASHNPNYSTSSNTSEKNKDCIARESLDIPEPENIKKIGVLMYGLLGDTLIRTPLLRELRSIYPRALIIAYVDPPGLEALSLTNFVDKTVVLDRRKKFIRIDLFYKFIHFLRMRLECVDLAIDLYMGKTSQFIANHCGARFVILAGFENTYCNWDSRQLPITQYQFKNAHHFGNPCLNALAFLTRSQPNLSTQPALQVDRLRALGRSQSERESFQTAEFFLISLGAGDVKKIPDPIKVGILCKYIFDMKNYIPVIIKNPNQENLQEALVNELNKLHVPSNQLEYLSLEQIAALMTQAKFVIVPDSGLFHIAVGLGVNILALFTYTNPELVRPDVNNCAIIFEPETPHHGDAGGLPLGIGTPSVETILATASSFIRVTESENANTSATA